jgi:hypothetical protein
MESPHRRQPSRSPHPPVVTNALSFCLSSRRDLLLSLQLLLFLLVILSAAKNPRILSEAPQSSWIHPSQSRRDWMEINPPVELTFRCFLVVIPKANLLLSSSARQALRNARAACTMLNMLRTIVVLACLLPCTILQASDEKQSSNPSYDYQVARTHEIKPHRRRIPVEGVQSGFHQLRLKLTVSSTGDVTNAEASGEDKLLKFWPQLQDEIYQWKFTPFEKHRKPIDAEVEEYIDLVPSERMPKNHTTPPTLLPTSKVIITLERRGCYGTCPSYTVRVSTEGIEFNGNSFVVATGKHTDKTDPNEVRQLAKKFIDADFYSMDSSYIAGVTDNPTYVLSIAIDGHKKEVEDYVGSWEGMPAIITELEDDVDKFANTQRWINGTHGLISKAIQH